MPKRPMKKTSAKKPTASKKAAKAPAKPAPPHAKTKAKAAPPPPAYDVVDALIESFATSNRISAFLLNNLSEDSWHAAPPLGKGRSIAAIACHMHNARVLWLESFGKKSKLPKKLDRLAATKEDVVKALDQSHTAISKVVGDALRTDGRIANFKAGAGPFLGYLMTHDAHHRGQICLMAKLVGHPLPQNVGYGMWEWSKR
jgi:uncharacterized damage-inducible protein DinB